MRILFYSSVIIPVINAARKSNRQVLLVKDDGVYLMVHSNNETTIGYADQCNPDIDPDYFDYANHYLGGNDFVEYFDPNDEIFDYVINFQLNLEISLTGEKIILSAVRGG